MRTQDLPSSPKVLSLVASHLPGKDLIKATHASHRWRTVLLAFPGLWMGLDFNCKTEALTFLERSKPTAISVYMDIEGHSKLVAGITFLCDNATRIETLAISGLEVYPPVFLSFLECPRRLDLSSGGTNDHHGIDDRMDIRLNLPNLIALTIRGGDTFPFDFLRLIQLYQTREPAVGRLLHLLSRCPLLKELEAGCDRGGHH